MVFDAVFQFAEAQVSEAFDEADVAAIVGTDADAGRARFAMEIRNAGQGRFWLADDQLFEGELKMNRDAGRSVASLRKLGLELLDLGAILERLAVAELAVPLLEPLGHAFGSRRLVESAVFGTGRCDCDEAETQN